MKGSAVLKYRQSTEHIHIYLSFHSVHKPRSMIPLSSAIRPITGAYTQHTIISTNIPVNILVHTPVVHTHQFIHYYMFKIGMT